jgi:hypothetical protein
MELSHYTNDAPKMVPFPPPFPHPARMKLVKREAQPPFPHPAQRRFKNNLQNVIWLTVRRKGWREDTETYIIVT